MAKKAEKKDTISIVELSEKVKPHIEVPEGLNVEVLDTFLSDLSILCSQKSGSAEDEISKKSDEIGELTKKQIEHITQKYDSVVNIDDKYAKALNLLGYSFNNIRKAIKVIASD